MTLFELCENAAVVTSSSREHSGATEVPETRTPDTTRRPLRTQDIVGFTSGSGIERRVYSAARNVLDDEEPSLHPGTESSFTGSSDHYTSNGEPESQQLTQRRGLVPQSPTSAFHSTYFPWASNSSKAIQQTQLKEKGPASVQSYSMSDNSALLETEQDGFDGLYSLFDRAAKTGEQDGYPLRLRGGGGPSDEDSRSLANVLGGACSAGQDLCTQSESSADYTTASRDIDIKDVRLEGEKTQAAEKQLATIKMSALSWADMVEEDEEAEQIDGVASIKNRSDDSQIVENTETDVQAAFFRKDDPVQPPQWRTHGRSKQPWRQSPTSTTVDSTSIEPKAWSLSRNWRRPNNTGPEPGKREITDLGSRLRLKTYIYPPLSAARSPIVNSKDLSTMFTSRAASRGADTTDAQLDGNADSRPKPSNGSPDNPKGEGREKTVRAGQDPSPSRESQHDTSTRTPSNDTILENESSSHCPSADGRRQDSLQRPTLADKEGARALCDQPHKKSIQESSAIATAFAKSPSQAQSNPTDNTTSAVSSEHRACCTLKGAEDQNEVPQSSETDATNIGEDAINCTAHSGSKGMPALEPVTTPTHKRSLSKGPLSRDSLKGKVGVGAESVSGAY